MQKKFKSFLIIVGLAQGTAAFADEYSITINLMGKNSYTISRVTDPNLAANCPSQVLDPTHPQTTCSFMVNLTQDPRSLFTITNKETACTVTASSNGGSKFSFGVNGLCAGISFKGNTVNLN